MQTLTKQECPQINNLTIHFEELEKEWQTKLKGRRKEIIKSRVEITEIDNRKTEKIQ